MYKGTLFFAYMQTFRLLFFAYKRNSLHANNRHALSTLTSFKIFFFFLYTLSRKFASPIGSFSLFNKIIRSTMAIIKNGLSMMMRGKVGAFSYYVSDTRQIVRQAQNNSNFGATATRSPQQQSRRVLWANLVNFYKGNKAWMKKSFENLKPGVSEFNKFMQANIGMSHVALSKEQARQGVWVAQRVQISEGSLPSVTPSAVDGDRSAIINVDVTVGATTTVAQFSQSIIDNNTAFRNGDAIVCVALGGTVAAPSQDGGFVGATYRYNEFVLDTASTELMTEAYPNWSGSEGSVLCGDAESFETYVYIHTRVNGGKLYVSTEKTAELTGTQLENIEAWGATSQMTLATESYKVDQDVPLMPGDSVVPSTGNDSSSGGGGGNTGPGDGNLE